MTDDHISVLATCGVFEPGFRGGGMVRAVVQTFDTVSDRVDLNIVTRDRDLGSLEPYPGLSGRWTRRPRSRVFYLNVHRAGQWLHLWRGLRSKKIDLLYTNGIWEPAFAILPLVAARLGFIHVRRILVSAHGE